MKKIIELITEELSDAFEQAGYDKDYAKVTLSNRPDLCEYQCNGALAGAKAYKKAPFMIDPIFELSNRLSQNGNHLLSNGWPDISHRNG